jgi:serine/threonine protein kinase
LGIVFREIIDLWEAGNSELVLVSASEYVDQLLQLCPQYWDKPLMQKYRLNLNTENWVERWLSGERINQSYKIRDFLQKCLEVDAFKRQSLTGLLQNEIFSKLTDQAAKKLLTAPCNHPSDAQEFLTQNYLSNEDLFYVYRSELLNANLKWEVQRNSHPKRLQSLGDTTEILPVERSFTINIEETVTHQELVCFLNENRELLL